jgi:hypothetical protein
MCQEAHHTTSEAPLPSDLRGTGARLPTREDQDRALVESYNLIAVWSWQHSHSLPGHTR